MQKLLLQYINIITKEYPNSCCSNVIDKINNREELVKFNKTNAISFLVSDGVLLLPIAAYKIFSFLKNIKIMVKSQND